VNLKSHIKAPYVLFGQRWATSNSKLPHGPSAPVVLKG